MHEPAPGGLMPLRPVPVSDGLEHDEPAAPDLAAILERAYLIAAGMASLAAAAITDAVARSIDPDAPGWEEGSRPTGAVAAGAAAGAAMQAGLLVVRGGLAMMRTAGGIASVVIGSLAGAERSAWVQERIADADDRGREGRHLAEDAATAFADAFVPVVLEVVLDRLDLDALVADRVDLDAVVAELDLDRVIDRVDVRRVVERVSLDEVAARLDVDAVAARIDVQAIVDRLDLVGIAQRVIDELDLPEIIRESTGAMSAETVDSIRIRGMDADRVVTGWVDRLLSRGDDVEPAPDQEPGSRP